MERRRVKWSAIAVVALAAASACSASETDTTPPDPVRSDPSDVTGADVTGADVTGADVAVAEDDELFTEREAVTAVDDEGQPVEPVTESLPPVAETGVPGIDSEDAFCRAWSRYAGSVQALSLAWALQAPTDAARLEVAAASALTDAVQAMSDELPPEIEANRQALTEDVPGPFLRRADRSSALLAEAGLGEDQIAELGAAWIDAITDQGVESESLSIEVAPNSVAALDAASQAFVDELPSVNEDPTLDTTEFDISPSLDYISATCPDQGILAGNDVIESGGA